MSWYHTPGKDHDVVISTRVQLARNMEGYAFVAHMKPSDAETLIRKVGTVLENGGFRRIDISSVSRAQAHAMVEQQYAGPSFIKVSLPHALYLNEPCHLSVMLCEDEHIRIQCILPGASPEEAWEGVRRVDELLDASFVYAYDKSGKWGYLTQNSRRIGTGLSIASTLFLPALTNNGHISALASDLSHNGFSIREAASHSLLSRGYLYQISNRISMGLSESEMLQRLKRAVNFLCEEERTARTTLPKNCLEALTNRIWRSWGILKYAYALPLGEFISLLSDVRLGVALGILDQVQMHEITTLFIEGLPATLTVSLEAQDGLSGKLDMARGALIRKKLKEAR